MSHENDMSGGPDSVYQGPIVLRRITLWLCSPCYEGIGEECHTPGCTLYLNRPPDMPLNEALHTVENVSDPLLEGAPTHEEANVRYRLALKPERMPGPKFFVECETCGFNKLVASGVAHHECNSEVYVPGAKGVLVWSVTKPVVTIPMCQECVGGVQ